MPPLDRTLAGLASNGLHVKLLKSKGLRFILGAKPGDHKFLFDHAGNHPEAQTLDKRERTGKGPVLHSFRWLADAPLNETHADVRINFLEYAETKGDGSIRRWSWVTDPPLNETNVVQVMRAARSRWHIENENFNTQKNHGYEFEHNFGHGKQHLSSVFAYECMLAFLIDQVQQHCCALFQKALAFRKSKIRFREQFRTLFRMFRIPNWASYWRAMSTAGWETALPDALDKSALDSY